MYNLEEKEKESRFGKIIKVSGPLVVAENMAGAKMYELVKIGWSKLVGEVIKLEKDTAQAPISFMCSHFCLFMACMR